MKNPLTVLKEKTVALKDLIKKPFQPLINKTKDVLRPVKNKANELIAKITPAPENQIKIYNRSGGTLLVGALVALGVVVAGPAAWTVAAGATAIGAMGVGFMSIQEADNVKHGIYQAQLKTAEAAAVASGQQTQEHPAPAVEPAPIAQVTPAKTEFAAVAEKKAEVEAPVAVPAAKVETPKPVAPPN